MTATTKQRLSLALGGMALLFCCGWLALGIYADREFGALHLFLKHRPSTRFLFYSPHGESDTLETTVAERSAEKDYTEFVELHDGRKRSITILN
ncbi:MAG: hypothetical protein QM796_21835 [Chthoniobacteraceae bacterium]